MRRAFRWLAVLPVLIAGLFAAEWAERAVRRKADMRAFDGHAAGRIETDMWRSYYERRPLRLFRQMMTLLGTQYHMPPLMRTRNAYRAAHAAFVFKDGHNRADYERALPELERYYADIEAQSATPFDFRKAARVELEWWILHRERSPELASALATLQAVIYGIPASLAAEHARLRAEAMILRDNKAGAITEADWRDIGAMLDRSWTSLHEAVNTAPASGVLAR